MARRARFHRYSRRTSSEKRGGRAWIIVAACISFLILSVAISVAVGLALGQRADAYNDSAEKLDISVKEHYSGGKKVKNVRAEAYQWGYGTSYYETDDLSVCLRDEDGFITYRSEIDVAIEGDIDMGSRSLAVEVGDLHESGGYVCGYIYSDALSEENPYLREIKKAYELALIDEAARGGVDDILIVGIDIDAVKTDELEAFLKEAAEAAGKATLGILIDTETVMDDEGLVKRLAACCDYIALDLREMSKYADSPESADKPSQLYSTLDSLKYFIKVYSMRVVFSSDNERLAKSARELGVTCTQIIE